MASAQAPYIAVVGPSEPDEATYALGVEAGRLLAQRGAVVVCGGRGGIMEAAALGVREADGLCIGILPGEDRAEANAYVSVAIATGLGELRNGLIVRASDAVLAVGGSWGTLSEVALAVRAGRTVVALGGWSAFDADGVPASGVVVARSVPEAVGLVLGERVSPVRVLFVSTPAIGHVFPMVPLAWALRAEGHEVLVATSGPALAVAGAGLAVVDAAPGFSRRRIVERIAQGPPEVAARIRGLGERELDDLRHTADYLAVVSDLLVDGAVEAARAWRPDLVVHSQIDGAGAVVARALGVRLVSHGFGLARTEGIVALLGERMGDAFSRVSTAAGRGERADAAIDVAPPSLLAFVGAPEGRPMRYVPYHGGGSAPGWLGDRRARVLVTLGTLEPRRGRVGPVAQVIAAAAELDVEVVVALGDGHADALGSVPPFVRVVGWTPLGLLLDGCAAVIHHGGSGTTLAALDAGLPQLVLPSGADRYINADAVQARGAGLRAEVSELSAALLGRLLSDGGLRVAAEEVRAEMRGMPSPASLVSELVALA